MIFLTTIEDDSRLTDGTCSVSSEFTNTQHGVEATARGCPAINEIATAIIVPQRAGVYHTFARDHTNGLTPFSCWVFGLDHEDAQVWVAPIDEETVVMMTDSRCPDALAMLRKVEDFLGQLLLQGMTDDGPVHQVAGVQDGQAGNTVERRCREIVVIAYHTDIGVGVVGKEHGVGIGAVAIVGTPHLRLVLRLQ